MKRLWLYFFPLLFVPNLGFSHQTTFGVLEVSDLLVVPLIFCLLIAQPAKFDQRVSKLKLWLWAFLVWALLSTLSIHLRYDYLDDVPIIAGSSLKLGRLALYVVAGLLITRSLGDPEIRQKWLWSLVAALFILGAGLLVGSGDHSPQPSDSLEGYKSYNVIIVSVAILCSYLLGLWSESVSTRVWNTVAGLAVLFGGGAVVLSTSFSTHGRGGWLAFAAGFGYIAWKRIHTVKIVAIAIVLSLAALASYHNVSTFKSLVDQTLTPDTTSGSEQVVDDGARFWSWRQEGAKFINAPIFGTGFYHRGGDSGLWETGSHNFFLQMFLETGIVGGTLIVMIFAVAWRQAGLPARVSNKVATATRAALITAIAGGMSGEYFYGGIGVMVLFSVLSVSGSLPCEKLAYVSDRGFIRPLRWKVAV